LEDEKVRKSLSFGFFLFKMVDESDFHQAETINRLLKKQSRQRSKRNVNREQQPTPGAPGGLTPDPEGAENGEDRLEPAVEPVPQMYRWLSRVENEGNNPEKRHVITFSVPTSVCAFSPNFAAPKRETPARSNQRCDFSGCKAVKKYRSVRNRLKGACSMQHLKALESIGA
jgi:Ino eighty subunit 2